MELKHKFIWAQKLVKTMHIMKLGKTRLLLCVWAFSHCSDGKVISLCLILICISLVATDGEYFFMYLLIISISPFEDCLPVF